MIWLTVFTGLLLALCFYLAVAPFYLEIDSTCNLYRVRFHHIAYVGLGVCDDTPVFYLGILGWQRQVAITAMLGKSKPAAARKKEKKNAVRPVPFRKIWGVIKSFRVIQCNINIDFGAVMTDAMMIAIINANPVIARNIRVNFLHQNSVRLRIKNNIASMAWSYIRS